MSEVHLVPGEHNLLMKYYLAEDIDIGHSVTNRLQGLVHFKATFSLIGFKAFS